MATDENGKNGPDLSPDSVVWHGGSDGALDEALYKAIALENLKRSIYAGETGPGLSPDKATDTWGKGYGGEPAVWPGVSAETLVKSIRWEWDDGEEKWKWKCEDFGVRCLRKTDGGQQWVEIDPDGIKFNAEPDWLVMGKPQKQEKAWNIPVFVRNWAVEGLAPSPSPPSPPETKVAHYEVQNHYGVGEEVKPQPPEDVDPIKIKVTVTSPVKMDAPLAAATALGGMIPGGEKTVSAGLPGVERPSVKLKKEITYVVNPNPPKVTWRLEYSPLVFEDYPPLNEGPKELEKAPMGIDLSAEPLPPGWQGRESITVKVAIGKEVEVYLKDVVDGMTGSSEFGYACNFMVALKPEVEQVDADVELVVITSSRHLGIQVQTLTLNVKTSESDRIKIEEFWKKEREAPLLDPHKDDAVIKAIDILASDIAVSLANNWANSTKSYEDWAGLWDTYDDFGRKWLPIFLGTTAGKVAKGIGLLSKANIVMTAITVGLGLAISGGRKLYAISEKVRTDAQKIAVDKFYRSMLIIDRSQRTPFKGFYPPGVFVPPGFDCGGPGQFTLKQYASDQGAPDGREYDWLEVYKKERRRWEASCFKEISSAFNDYKTTLEKNSFKNAVRAKWKYEGLKAILEKREDSVPQQ